VLNTLAVQRENNCFMKQFFFFTLCLFSYYANAQNVGINATGAAPNSSAILDVSATNKGLLLPRVSLTNATDATTIASPATALIVYNINAANTGGLTGTGLYINKGIAALPDWKKIQDGPVANGWALTGNSGIDSLANFLGTTDNKPLMFRVNNNYAGRIGTDGSVAFGRGTLQNNSLGKANVAIGDSALHNNTTAKNLLALGNLSLKNNTTGSNNIAIGSNALLQNVSGKNNLGIGTAALRNVLSSDNIAIGDSALFNNQNGTRNLAIGNRTLKNSGASNNIAIGNDVLTASSDGHSNIGIGSLALQTTRGGRNNIAIGLEALNKNYEGEENIAIGTQALSNEDTYSNIAIGHRSLQYCDGGSNVAIGTQAMLFTTTGSTNVAIGDRAMQFNYFGTSNVSLGAFSMANNSSASNNVAVGYSALNQNRFGGNNTVIGYQAMQAGGDNTVANTVLGFNAGYNLQAYGNVLIGEKTGEQLKTGYDNVWVGKLIGSTGTNLAFNNTVAIGANVLSVTANNQARIGNAFMTSIGGQVGWSTLSDGRYKTNVKEDIPGLAFIKKLRPVSFTYTNAAQDKNASKEQIEIASKIVHTGFIAQEVEKAAADLKFNFSGVDKPANADAAYSLRYAEFVVPLIKAMQEQQVLIEKLTERVKQLEQQKLP